MRGEIENVPAGQIIIIREELVSVITYVMVGVLLYDLRQVVESFSFALIQLVD